MLACATHAADFHIDPQRSHADFGVRLLWVRQVTGRFQQIGGEVNFNGRRDTATVDARIDVNSVAMDSDRFRRWVLAPEFFDVEHYPTIRFVSAPVTLDKLQDGGDLSGWLTLRGITQPTVLEILPSHCRLDAAPTCTIELRGSVQRSDFNMSGHRATLSDRVELGLSIELDREQG
ncbi:YceI family protein [Dyella sp.]|uniref:YceI family protein n=1 Tax=Dyella sp. TaxID=1869338 RepID=UPI002ED49E4E